MPRSSRRGWLRFALSAAVLLVLGGALVARWAERARDGRELVQAAMGGDAGSVERLLRRGTDPRRARLKGLTPLQAAVYSGHESIVERLLRAGSDPSEAVYQAILMRRARLLRVLAEHGADLVSRRPGHHGSPMEFARERGDAAVLAVLASAARRPGRR